MFVKTFAFFCSFISAAVPELFAVVDEPSVFAWGKGAYLVRNKICLWCDLNR